MAKKYEMIEDKTLKIGDRLLHKIRALIDIENACVKSGDEGGWIEKEENLSQDGDAWVSGDARVYDDARVYGDAWVSGNAWVYGDAQVSGNARVCGNAWVSGNARVSDNAWVSGNARVFGEYKMITVSNMGREQRTTTYFVCADKKIRVNCGCFFGTLEEFRRKVRETHGDSKHAQAYLMAADLAESVLDVGNGEERSK